MKDISLDPARKKALALAGTVSLTGALVSVALLAGIAGGAGAQTPKKGTKADAKTAATQPAPVNPIGDNTPLTEDQKILHVLNRMGFGPRPGDVEKVRAMGLSNYIAKQLMPESIDDSGIENKLRPLSLLTLSSADYATLYRERQNKTVKAFKKEEKNAKSGGATTAAATSGTPQTPGGATTATPDVNPATLAQASPQDRRAMLAAMTPEQRTAIREYMEAQKKIRGIGAEMMMDKTVRAVESERQFQEVMVDFWSNHFNIDVRKGPCVVYKPVDEREVIRKHAFGKFHDLLEASAKSPAMLFYLDNAQSSAPMPDMPRRPALRRPGAFRPAGLNRPFGQGQGFAGQQPPAGQPPATPPPAAAAAKRRGGLNENYAREIMELHTLGVDGGYTQKDVQEVARCLTGWTINPQTGSFIFTPRRHDQGEKVVLGVTIPAGGGMEDGEKVLEILANHPSTMRHISTQLCERLVSDEPPASLVDKCVETWKRTDGDLREIYRTIVTSPEFFSRAAYRQKIKSPFEYAVSCVRAVGGVISPEAVTQVSEATFPRPETKGKGMPGGIGRTIFGQVATLGQPLYQYQAPTGYPEDSRKWVSSGALISRLNFTLTLAGGRLADVDMTPARSLLTGATEPAQMVNRLGDVLLHGEMTPSTRATLLKQVEVTPDNPNIIATDAPTRALALVLGAPEFQRR